jgi:hypothetical protein
METSLPKKHVSPSSIQFLKKIQIFVSFVVLVSRNTFNHFSDASRWQSSRENPNPKTKQDHERYDRNNIILKAKTTPPVSFVVVSVVLQGLEYTLLMTSS